MQEEFSLLLKMARKDAGLTQKELAEKLGVATGTVQQWELGTRFPRVSMLKEIENTLKIALVPSDVEEEKNRDREKKMLDAWKAAELKAGKKLSFDEAMSYYKIDVATTIRLEMAIQKLNDEGRKVALERIEELTLIDKYTLPKDITEELTQIPKYKRTEAENSAESNGEYTDTGKQKKPSADDTMPTNGI